MQKKCIHCGEPATHKFTRIKDGQVYDLYLCAEHAAQMSKYQKSQLPPLGEILEGLLKKELKSASDEQASMDQLRRCPVCGSTWGRYKKSFLLGCSHCYQEFHDELLTDLRRLHGATNHVGRKPGGGMVEPVEPGFAAHKFERVEEPAQGESPSQGGAALINDPVAAIEQLKAAMNKALAREDYAKAAQYRDQIRELKENAKKNTGQEDSQAD